MAATKPKKSKRAPRIARKPLEAGQLWRLGAAELKIEMVGKLLVHYRLALPKAVRVAISVSSITSLEKYMKTNKAILVKG